MKIMNFLMLTLLLTFLKSQTMFIMYIVHECAIKVNVVYVMAYSSMTCNIYNGMCTLNHTILLHRRLTVT